MKRFLLLTLTVFIAHTTFSQVSNFPWTDDFESFSNCGTACAGPCNLSGGWTNATGDGAEWIVDQGGTSSLNTGPSVDHNPGTSGGTYLYTETSGCTNQTALLISPTFDFSILSNPTVNFWWHMFGATMGDMHFDLDTGTGNWIIDVIPSWTANTDQWQNREINLTNLAGGKSNVRFRIRGETGTSFTSDMAIDDFRIFNDIPDDLAITEIISPKQDCGVSGLVNVEVEITNLGASDQNNFSVAYQVNDDPPVVQQYIGLLPSDNKDNFVFQTPVNLNAYGDVVIKTWVVFPQDLNNLNDTLSEGVKEAFPLEPVDFAGFTGNNIFNAAPGWREGSGNTPAGISSEWINSDSTQQVFLGAPTAKINLSGTQNREWLVSPPILISNSARLFFSCATTSKDGILGNVMGSDDKLDVFVSTDCGNSFSNLFTVDNTSGLSNSLRQFAVNLNQYVGQEVVLGFRASDGPINDPEDYDFHLSLIEARRVFPNDVGIISFRTQNGDDTIAANTGENVFIRLKNFGSNTVSNIPVITTIGSVNFQDVYTPNLGSNAEVEINIGAYFGNINGPQNVVLKSYTIYNGDTINANDTLQTFLIVDGAKSSLQTERALKNLHVVPNPFSDAVSLDLSELSADINSIEVRDIRGSLIDRIEWDGSRILRLNTTNYRRGVYFIRINGDSFSHTLKSIKE